MRWLWRISNHCDLSGLAGEKAGGRWHTRGPGKRVVYLAEHPAAALIEILVHLKGQPQFLPNTFQLIKIKVAEEVLTDSLAPPDLPEDWREQHRHTASLGDAWLIHQRSALFAVPSAPSPESLNYLFNPLHPQANGLQIEWCKRIRYDRRLFRIFD